MLALCCLACAGEPAALTREQATVLRVMLADVTPRLLEGAPAGEARRRLQNELHELERTLRRGTPPEVLRAAANVRATIGSSMDRALELVLAQAEAAAGSGNGASRQ